MHNGSCSLAGYLLGASMSFLLGALMDSRDASTGTCFSPWWVIAGCLDGNSRSASTGTSFVLWRVFAFYLDGYSLYYLTGDRRVPGCVPWRLLSWSLDGNLLGALMGNWCLPHRYSYSKVSTKLINAKVSAKLIKARRAFSWAQRAPLHCTIGKGLF